jgi:hypothetical protein
MKTLRTLFAVTLVVTLLAASTAMAQGPTISVYFGPNQESVSQAQTGTQFKIWIVLSNINDTVNAVEYKLTLPPEVAIVDPGLYPGAIDVGNASTGSAIGLPECLPVFDSMDPMYQTLVVAEMTAVAVADFPAFNVTITEFTGSPQDPGTAPRYSNCESQLTNLTPEGGTLQSSVGSESASWSAVKSLY